MENLLIQFASRPKLGIAARYFASTIIAPFFFPIRLALEGEPHGRPFLLFVMPVFIASLLFDRGSGFVAIGPSTFVGVYLFVEPVGEAEGTAWNDWLGVFVLINIGVSIAALTGALRAALEKIAANERAKATLLRELNHRVRKDLQTMSAMLWVAGRTGADPRTTLTEAADRVLVMGHVYDRLGSDGAAASVGPGSSWKGSSTTWASTSATCGRSAPSPGPRTWRCRSDVRPRSPDRQRAGHELPQVRVPG